MTIFKFFKKIKKTMCQTKNKTTQEEIELWQSKNGITDMMLGQIVGLTAEIFENCVLREYVAHELNNTIP